MQWQCVAYISSLPSALLGPSSALITEIPAHGRAVGQPWTINWGRDKPNTQSEGHLLSTGHEATREALGYALEGCRGRQHL